MPPKQTSSRSQEKNMANVQSSEEEPNLSSNKQPKKNPPSQTKSSGQLKKEDYLILVHWLKVQSNYNACFGSENTTKVGCPPSSNINGFNLMDK